MFSQLVCRGCSKILTYPAAAISCRCRNCSTVNAAHYLNVSCPGCEHTVLIPMNTLTFLCPVCATVTDIPEELLPPLDDAVDLRRRDTENYGVDKNGIGSTMYVSYPAMERPVEREARETARRLRREAQERERCHLLEVRQRNLDAAATRAAAAGPEAKPSPFTWAANSVRRRRRADGESGNNSNNNTNGLQRDLRAREEVEAVSGGGGGRCHTSTPNGDGRVFLTPAGVSSGLNGGATTPPLQLRLSSASPPTSSRDSSVLLNNTNNNNNNNNINPNSGSDNMYMNLSNGASGGVSGCSSLGVHTATPTTEVAPVQAAATAETTEQQQQQQQQQLNPTIRTRSRAARKKVVIATRIL